jgi:hypothetical protein
MGIGIDWVSAAIFVAAYLVSQIRTLPLAVRYGVLAAAFTAIALYRLRHGAFGYNLAFVGLGGVLAVYYAVRAFQARPR